MTYKTITSEQLNRVLSSTATNSFTENIARMHDIYRLPKNTVPTLDPELLGESPLRRLDKFRNTLEQELNEYNIQEAAGPLPLRDRLIAFQAMTLDTHTAEQIEDARQDMLTDLGDWFADIVVYCTSEAMKFGLPLTDIQDAVMGSNFTKLASDGIPRYDDNGKFQKDLTNFVAPEPSIKSLLFYHKRNTDGQIEASAD